MAGIVLYQFIAYCLVGGIIMYFLLRGFHLVYGKIWTNHHPSVEPLATKIVLLWAYNSVLALTAVAITILYSVFVTQFLPIEAISSINLLATIAILFAVLNTAVRISTYGYIERNGELNVDQDVAEHRKTTFRRSYFSFINGLILLVFIGIGVAIVADSNVTTTILDGVSLGGGFYYALLIIASTLSLSIVSEILLWVGPLTVPNYLAD